MAARSFDPPSRLFVIPIEVEESLAVTE